MFKNKKGVITIETIIVIVLILTVGIMTLIYVGTKLNGSQTSMKNNLEENYEDKSVVIDYSSNNKNNGDNAGDIIDGKDEGEGSFTDGEDNKKELINIAVSLEKKNIKNREITITLENLDSIEYINSSNNGQVEIVKIEGDNVTLTVKGGEAVDYIVLSGTYTPANEKEITAHLTPDYIDDEGFSGTLSQYIYDYKSSDSKQIVYPLIKDTNDFSPTYNYNLNHYNGTLIKSGTVITTIAKGSVYSSKNVTSQNLPNYNEIINDNGITTAYEGTLSQYVYSGSASTSKTVSQSQTSSNNSFNNTIYYNSGGYTGTLTKNGSVTSNVVSGSASSSKTVTAQNYSYYSDGEGYTGTLTQYVYSGSASTSKTVSQSQTSSSNSFNSTIYYNSGGYTGTLSKNGSVTSSLISGSASASKTVAAQNYSYYSDSQGYAGTLTQYVYSGSASTSKTVSQSQTSTSNSFNSTLYYNSGGYIGTLSKNGNSIASVTKGSPSSSKTVTGKDSASYTETINDNGVTTSYKGTLSSYLYGTEYIPAKTASCSYIVSSRQNNTTKFPQSLSLNNCSKVVNENNVVVTNLSTPLTYTKGSTYSKSTLETTVMSIYAQDKSSYHDTHEYLYERLKPSLETLLGPITYIRWNGDYIDYPTIIDGVQYYYVRNVYFERYLPMHYTTYNASYIVEPAKTVSIYKYQGTVTKPDTRVYNYTQNYTGIASTPDTRVYKYQGIVTKPDTRVYNYTQSYTGTVSTIDTRVYKYQGTVTKPDTRVYNYTQNYSGVVSTPDTRIYKYQGIVTKPDTRVYNYTQNYSGTINRPETTEFRYKGTVIKPAEDTREIEYLYQYDLDIYYYKK